MLFGWVRSINLPTSFSAASVPRPRVAMAIFWLRVWTIVVIAIGVVITM